MTEFEWVRELNEGVKKIYSDMADAGLPAPEYRETPNTVTLILRNNIDERTAHRNKASDSKAPKGQNEPLNEPLEEKLIQLIRDIPTCTYDALAESLEVSRSTVKRAMKLLAEQGRVERVGGKRYGYWQIND